MSTTLKELVADEDGEDMEALLARTEGVIAALQGQFTSGAQDRIDRLGELFHRGWEALATREATAREMRRILHDLKGEAGTFGFELITEIAELLGVYLRQTAVPQQRQDVIASHLEVLRQVWNDRIEGEGDIATRAMLDRLIQMTATT